MLRGRSIRERSTNVLIHVVAWSLIILLPLIFSVGSESVFSFRRYVTYLFIPTTLIVVFYINFFLFIDRFIIKKREIVKFLIANFFLILVVIALNYVWRIYIIKTTTPSFAGSISVFVLMSFCVVLCVAIKMTAQWYRSEVDRSRYEEEMTSARLKNLKSQINPHFFFNTLNNIYALIAVDQANAQYAVHSLSKMMRYVLYNDNVDYIPLDQELGFVRRYIELMTLRLSPDQARVNVDLPEDVTECKVAPLLFINLIENAFKHGVSPTEYSEIDISIKIEEEQRGKVLVCRVENRDFPKSEMDKSGSGIGVENLKKRLSILYPDSHTLSIERVDSKYISILKVDVGV